MLFNKMYVLKKLPCPPNSTLLNRMLRLVQVNVGEMYERCRGWGWNTKLKLHELRHPHARFLIVYRASDHAFVGFMHYRFDREEHMHEPMVYIWDLQIETEFQRQGLGTRLLQYVEQLARQRERLLLQLTVFTENRSALRFYLRHGFEIATHSPRGEDYVILSKRLE